MSAYRASALPTGCAQGRHLATIAVLTGGEGPDYAMYRLSCACGAGGWLYNDGTVSWWVGDRQWWSRRPGPWTRFRQWLALRGGVTQVRIRVDPLAMRSAR